MDKKTPVRADGSASIGRLEIWKYICQRKFLPNIHSYHILSVITIFFEELKEAMLDGEKIKIPNFITFRMINRKSYSQDNYVSKKNIHIDSRHLFRIKLAPKLKNLLKKLLDKDKTFPNKK